MSPLLQKIKLPLEILGIVVGLIIGANTLWWQVQQWLPANPLVGSLAVVDVRLPGDLLEDLKAHSGKIEQALLKSKELRKILPNETTRNEVFAQVNDIVERHALSLDLLHLTRKGVWVLTVKNNRDRPLREVRAGFLSAPDRVTIISPDGTIKDAKDKRVIDLGDLPPQGELRLISWELGSASGPLGLTLSHQDGVGEIYRMHPISRTLWESGGIFISFEHTTLGLLALIFLYFGLSGIYRRYLARREKRLDQERHA